MVIYNNDSIYFSVLLDTYLLTSIIERDITNDSAHISYTTFSGCSDFPDLEVELSISECNATMMKMTIRNDYATNRNDETFKLSSLIPECVYDYTIQVFNGNTPMGKSATGIFTTLSNDDANVDNDDDDDGGGGGGGGGDSSVIECSKFHLYGFINYNHKSLIILLNFCLHVNKPNNVFLILLIVTTWVLIPEVTSTCTCVPESKGILYVNFTEVFYHCFR